MSKNKTNKFSLGMTNMFHGYLPSSGTKSLVTLAIIAALGAPGIEPTWALAVRLA
ncbi:hypothetical protein [Shewanella benthica]|uniref:hypothetical protein n=1 Tax=Shewanella benthica TaxID=43661 RepID=UPI001559F037|nr:hypothetical protein [Shewanella benthica]